MLHSTMAQSEKPSASTATGNRRYDLNPKAPAFVPYHALMNEQVDAMAAALDPNFELTGTTSTCTTGTPLDEQVGGILSSMCNAASLVPPGLEPSPDWLHMASLMPPGLEPQPDWLPLLPSVDVFSLPESMRPQTGSKGGRKGKNARQKKGSPSGANSSERKGSHTMKAQLQALQSEDPATIFIARGINKLGFSSAEILRAHFGQYGKVRGIYVSHSRVKTSHGMEVPLNTTANDATVHRRSRAGPLGFVVMKHAEAAARILAEGPEQNVNGVTVRLQPFHRHEAAKEIRDDDECELDFTDMGQPGHSNEPLKVTQAYVSKNSEHATQFAM